MKLQEQLNRTKELMGLQPLNEGVFKKVGKFSDIFKSKKYKNKTGEVVAQFIPPSEIPEDKYETKYGNLLSAPTEIEGLTELNTLQHDKTSVDKNTDKTTGSREFKQNFFDASIQTIYTPQPLLSDPTKKVNTKSFLLYYQERVGNEFYTYQYLKIYYFIDDKITDIFGGIQEDGQQTCATNTLEGKNGNCEFSSEIKERILKGFKDNTQIQAFLDRID
jgi:hypothetical protein